MYGYQADYIPGGPAESSKIRKYAESKLKQLEEDPELTKDKSAFTEWMTAVTNDIIGPRRNETRKNNRNIPQSSIASTSSSASASSSSFINRQNAQQQYSVNPEMIYEPSSSSLDKLRYLRENVAASITTIEEQEGEYGNNRGNIKSAQIKNHLQQQNQYKYSTWNEAWNDKRNSNKRDPQAPVEGIFHRNQGVSSLTMPDMSQKAVSFGDLHDSNSDSNSSDNNDDSECISDYDSKGNALSCNPVVSNREGGKEGGEMLHAGNNNDNGLLEALNAANKFNLLSTIDRQLNISTVKGLGGQSVVSTQLQRDTRDIVDNNHDTTASTTLLEVCQQPAVSALKNDNNEIKERDDFSIGNKDAFTSNRQVGETNKEIIQPSTADQDKQQITKEDTSSVLKEDHKISEARPSSSSSSFPTTSSIMTDRLEIREELNNSIQELHNSREGLHNSRERIHNGRERLNSSREGIHNNSNLPIYSRNKEKDIDVECWDEEEREREEEGEGGMFIDGELDYSGSWRSSRESQPHSYSQGYSEAKAYNFGQQPVAPSFKHPYQHQLQAQYSNRDTERGRLHLPNQCHDFEHQPHLHLSSGDNNSNARNGSRTDMVNGFKRRDYKFNGRNRNTTSSSNNDNTSNNSEQYLNNNFSNHYNNRKNYSKYDNDNSTINSNSNNSNNDSNDVRSDLGSSAPLPSSLDRNRNIDRGMDRGGRPVSLRETVDLSGMTFQRLKEITGHY